MQVKDPQQKRGQLCVRFSVDLLPRGRSAIVWSVVLAANDSLTQFVRDALSSGRSRQEIRFALVDAGWSEREITASLAAFAATDFTPPVPRPRAQLTARDAFVYLLLFTSMAFVAAYLVSLIHSILDLSLPDPGDGEWVEKNAINGVRWSIATLLVACPVFVWMTHYTSRQISEDAGRRRSLVRKWLTYAALFVAALVFFGDAVVVVYSFLMGEVTLRFILKGLTVACVAGTVFSYYLHDIEAAADEK